MGFLDDLDPKQKQKFENRLLGMREGIAAAELGKGLKHCPYVSGHPLRKGWRIGNRRRRKQLDKERQEANMQPNVLLIEPGLKPTRFAPSKRTHQLSRARVEPNAQIENDSLTRDLRRIYKASKQ